MAPEDGAHPPSAPAGSPGSSGGIRNLPLRPAVESACGTVTPFAPAHARYCVPPFHRFMKLQIVPARTGVQWVKLGVQTFWRQPMALAALFFLAMASMS